MLERMAPRLARREASALATARKDLNAEIDLRRVIQFFFYEQWHALRRYCAQRSIRVVGDIAIFVAYDTPTCGRTATSFAWKDDLEPEAVSGEPHAFSATGQRWGTPLYDWDAIRCEATIGGSTVCAGEPRLAITSASITSADSINSGRSPPTR